MKEDFSRSQLYSEELGITLRGKSDEELFKWFLASVLFGSRISETIAKHTYKTFKKYRLLTPERIVEAGWEFLVSTIMREGGYVRYDGKKSTQILQNCEMLIQEYDGKLTKLHAEAEDSEDLEKRLLKFYSVGPVTVNIFLRELRPYWKKADPEPLPVVKKAARELNINLKRYERKGMAFTRTEAGLVRLRKKTGKR